MNVDMSEVFTARVRGLQAIYPEAHAALKNWGLWCLDLRGVFPGDIKPPRTYDVFDRGEWDRDGYGDEVGSIAPPERLRADDRKAERAEDLPHDPKTAFALDERLHAPGGLPVEIRATIRWAYASREIPENQYPGLAGCGPDAFCERLEAALQFAGRFA